MLKKLYILSLNPIFSSIIIQHPRVQPKIKNQSMDHKYKENKQIQIYSNKHKIQVVYCYWHIKIYPLKERISQYKNIQGLKKYLILISSKNRILLILLNKLKQS